MAAAAVSLTSLARRPSSPTASDARNAHDARSPQIFRSALILRKSTQWQYQKELTGLADDALKKHLIAQGMDVNEVMANERRQGDAVREIVARLQQANISTRIVERDELRDALPHADIVFSAGGDGTFLTAAAAVRDETPVVGINTDPIGSEGHLCVGRKNPPRDLIEKLLARKLKWIRRSRIRVTVKDPSKRSSCQNDEESTNLALNEVFLGEDDAAKVSTYNISIDDQPIVKQKSSGLIVTTGSGSTSWYLGMNRVDETTVTSLLEVLQGMGINVANNRQLAADVAQKYNERLPFEPDHPNLAFSVREAIFNATFQKTPTRGFATKIRLESRLANGHLVLDGSTKIPFPRGSIAILEILPSDSLVTIAD